VIKIADIILSIEEKLQGVRVQQESEYQNPEAAACVGGSSNSRGEGFCGLNYSDLSTAISVPTRSNRKRLVRVFYACARTCNRRNQYQLTMALG
jgi:hypothetical protein